MRVPSEFPGKGDGTPANHPQPRPPGRWATGSERRRGRRSSCPSPTRRPRRSPPGRDTPGSGASGLRLGPVVADADVDAERAGRGRTRRPSPRARAPATFDNSGSGTSSSSSSCTWSTSRAPLPSSREPPRDADHRDLDDVRVRALHDEVDGDALAEAARLRGSTRAARAPAGDGRAARSRSRRAPPARSSAR